MRHLTAMLESALKEAKQLKTEHAAQIEALTMSWEAKLAQERAALKEEFEKEMTAERKALLYEKSLVEQEFKDFRDKTEPAKVLWIKYQTGQIGFLSTDNLPKKLLFDKLAERWYTLKREDLGMIEAVLYDRVISI